MYADILLCKTLFLICCSIFQIRRFELRKHNEGKYEWHFCPDLYLPSESLSPASSASNLSNCNDGNTS